jgi:hypothetical protein
VAITPVSDFLIIWDILQQGCVSNLNVMGDAIEPHTSLMCCNRRHVWPCISDSLIWDTMIKTYNLNISVLSTDMSQINSQVVGLRAARCAKTDGINNGFESLNVKRKFEIRQVHQCNSTYPKLLELMCCCCCAETYVVQNSKQQWNINSGNPSCTKPSPKLAYFTHPVPPKNAINQHC